MPSDLCLHCGRKPGTHARGLCSVCHRTPGVRDRFPYDEGKSTGGGDTAWEFTELSIAPSIPYVYLSGPCPYPPGSNGKKRFMTWRDRNGYLPFHPLDNVPDDRRGSSLWEAVVGEIARRMED
jgi:hypothetical protein